MTDSDAKAKILSRIFSIWIEENRLIFFFFLESQHSEF